MAVEAKNPLRTDDRHDNLMNYGPASNHWNEYIFCAYADCQHEVVF